MAMCEKTVYEVVKSISDLSELHEAGVLKGSLIRHVAIYEYYIDRLKYNQVMKYSDCAMMARTDAADTFNVSEELVSKIKHKFEKAVLTL